MGGGGVNYVIRDQMFYRTWRCPKSQKCLPRILCRVPRVQGFWFRYIQMEHVLPKGVGGHPKVRWLSCATFWVLIGWWKWYSWQVESPLVHTLWLCTTAQNYWSVRCRNHNGCGCLIHCSYILRYIASPSFSMLAGSNSMGLGTRLTFIALHPRFLIFFNVPQGRNGWNVEKYGKAWIQGYKFCNVSLTHQL